MSAESAVVAIDVGTSGVRAALVEPGRGAVRAARVPRASSVDGARFDAASLEAEVERAVSDLALDRHVAAIGVTAHIGSVAVDEHLDVVMEAGGWADARGLDLLEAAPARLREDILERAGRPALCGGALSLALELKASEMIAPGSADRVRAILSPKDFILARLTGTCTTDVIDAAYTLAADVRRGEWHRQALAALGIPAAWFPPQVSPISIVGEVSAGAASRTGVPVGTPVVSGGPDGSVGLGLLLGERAESIADIAGTTDVLGMLLTDASAAPAGAVLNPALVPHRWVAGGATGTTGGAVAQWRRLVGAVDDGELASTPFGCDGLQVLPSMSGERFPRWRSASRGAVLGQRATHGAAAMLRAAQEGSAFAVREGLDVLDPGRSLPVLLAGGAARSAHVAQLRADCFARTVSVASEPDATLLGAAALAFVGASVVPDLDAARDALGVRFRDVEPRIEAGRSTRVYEAWREARAQVAG